MLAVTPGATFTCLVVSCTAGLADHVPYFLDLKTYTNALIAPAAKASASPRT